MRPISCLHEEAMISAVRTETWTDDLRIHLSSCARCQQIVQIAGFMHSLAAAEDCDRPLPDARLIWLKARLAHRQASAAEALKPVETFQRIAWGVSALVLLSGMFAKWTQLEHAVVWLNSRWGALVSQAGWAGLLLVAGILTLSVVAAASLIGGSGFHGNEAGSGGGGMKRRPVKNRSRVRNLPILLALLLSVGCSRFDENLVGEFQHRSTDGFRRLQVASTGQIEFTEDERDIQHISPGGHVVIQERKGLTTRKLEIESGADGTLSRSYTYRGEPRPFDDEARAWFGALLQRLIRERGYEAEARAQRILQRQGPVAVLDEISRIKSDHVKSTYFVEMAKSGILDLAVKERVIRQASEEILSDGHKAELFEKLMAHFWNETSLREGLILSVNTVHSDGEMARLLSRILERPDTSAKDLERILTVVERISSDGEKSRVLQQLAARCAGTNSVRAAFFQAVNTVRSDGERRETLSVFLKNEGVVREDLVAVLASAAQISSDGEKASLFVEFTQYYEEDATLRSAFFKAIDTLRSDADRSRVLSLLLTRKPVIETLQSVLQSAMTLSSDGEKAALLVGMARECVNNAELLASFLEVSHSLSSDGEYRRVMSAFFEDTNFLRKIALQKGT